MSCTIAVMSSFSCSPISVESRLQSAANERIAKLEDVGLSWAVRVGPSDVTMSKSMREYAPRR